MFLIILITATAIETPTPAPIKNTKIFWEILTPESTTCELNTETSGSAIVAKVPKAIAKIINIVSLDALFTDWIIKSPIGIIVESIPESKRASPTLAIATAIKKLINTFSSNL